jgi:hypothetical protein
VNGAALAKSNAGAFAPHTHAILLSCLCLRAALRRRQAWKLVFGVAIKRAQWAKLNLSPNCRDAQQNTLISSIVGTLLGVARCFVVAEGRC